MPSHTVWTALKRQRVSLVQSLLNTIGMGFIYSPIKLSQKTSYCFWNNLHSTLHISLYTPLKKTAFKAVRGISGEQNQMTVIPEFSPTSLLAICKQGTWWKRHMPNSHVLRPPWVFLAFFLSVITKIKHSKKEKYGLLFRKTEERTQSDA